MTRNMEKRVEIAWPILNETLRDRILSYIDISLTDTAKLRELLPNRSYTPLGFFAQVRSDGKVVRFDSQAHFMEESQRRLRKAAEAAVEKESVSAKTMAAAPSEKTGAPDEASMPAASASEGTEAEAAPASALAETTDEPKAGERAAEAGHAPSGRAGAALEPDEVEAAKAPGQTAIMPHVEAPAHKPSLLVRALAFAIRISNKRK